jgi:hypothetical protein
MVLKNKNQRLIEVKEDNKLIKIKNMMKHYWSPTPKKWRKLGDSLLAVATVIAIGGIWQWDTLKELFTVTELRAMIGASIALGVVGKFLTNFFKEDEKVEE